MAVRPAVVVFVSLLLRVLRLLIDPKERRLRRSLDSAGIIVAAEHLGNVLSGSQTRPPVEPEEHSSLFDRSDSAIDDLSVIDEPPDDEFVSKSDPSPVPRESFAAMKSHPKLESMAVAGISGLSLGGRPTNVWAPRYQQQAGPTQNGRSPAQPVNRTTAQNAATTGFARWRRNLEQNATSCDSEFLNQAPHSALPRAHFGSPLEAARTQPPSLTYKKWESATARSWDDGPMLAPQTFYPARDQSTGLETLFSSAARVRDPSWLEYIYSSWLNSALNGHEGIAQRFLQLATIPGLFASWMPMVNSIYVPALGFALWHLFANEVLRLRALKNQTRSRAFNPGSSFRDPPEAPWKPRVLAALILVRCFLAILWQTSTFASQTPILDDDFPTDDSFDGSAASDAWAETGVTVGSKWVTAPSSVLLTIDVLLAVVGNRWESEFSIPYAS
ncbi:hypothetical protein HDU89_005391 [Geranomyces variabilis]|nr:hypothetical protein HDU89_005391 [Geranomyces variabilis]